MRYQDKLHEWQARREDADRLWRTEREDADKKARHKDFMTELAIISVIAILAALLGGWAQSTFQRDPVINNYPQVIIVPTPNTPNVSSVTTSPTYP